jgi:hypothetical protein
MVLDRKKRTERRRTEQNEEKQKAGKNVQQKTERYQHYKLAGQLVAFCSEPTNGAC